MIIENPDAFKSWLTSILEPLCDADPAALAKYVYALVKKDKPLDELREVMVDQLDVFLQQETKPFVEMLFKSLESQEYLKPGQEKKQPTPPPEELPPKEPQPPVENHVAMNNDVAPPGVATTSAAGPRSGAESRARSPAAGTLAGAAAPPRVVLNRAARLAAPAPRDRHPLNEHTLVKVLPLTELLEEPVDQPPRRRDRRGDSTRDKEDRRRRRSRSWERRARARRHARDNEHNNDVRRRPLSRSPSPRGRYRNRSPPLPTLERQSSRSRSRSPVPRDRDHERDRDRLRMPREMERDRMSRDREHRDRLSRSRDRERSRDRSRDRSTSPHEARLDHNDAYKRRCRDFDEKGYCMRGDLCQWDHGSDPVVLEDAAAALSSVLALPPTVPEYNPLTPDIWCGGAGPFPQYPHPHPHHAHPPRELIPIPRVRHDVPAPRAGPPGPPRHPAPHKKNFDYSRFGPARPPLPANAVNCSLEVKKVPRGLNDITHLNNHFCKFGKIVNIQVCYDGDPEAALITFSNPTEANVAYKSTEAVLNNRFIKVFWHNPENKQENMAPGGQQNNKQNDRQNPQHPMSHNKVLINRDNIKATADNKQLMEKEKELANGIEPKKEAVKPIAKSKQIMEMHKRAQALLETQLQQQMLLIQRLESGNVTEAQRTALLEAINSAQEGIEKLRKELVAYNGTLKQMQDESVARTMSRLQLAQQAKKPKTKEEAQKEILDAELDLFNKQQEGQDVTELTKRIAELRRQMAIQFPTHIMRRPHASYRIVKRKLRGGRFNTPTRFTRGGLTTKIFNHSMNQSVDHRPRALLISGFEADELDALVAHFSQYGEVISKEVELSVPQLVLQYKSRVHAEHAAANGKHYNDRTLSITWVGNTSNNRTTPTTTEPRPAPSRNGDATHDNKDEPAAALPEETLLRFDEEEEEEADEERSWRR
ncbi:zinc finger protein swm isoform X3 [Anticarsia gemmatalis]|uniref:zinc finger protein swm isoform X3 n=1 Tax=Anticarsia gemmatalis TaxID=129554 RepID=UPI003F76DD54